MIPVLFLGNTAQLIALALVIGGMLALGAFTAPVLFSHFARPEAGNAMTVIFRRYDVVLAVALVLLLVGEALRWWVLGTPVWTVQAIARFAVLAGLVVSLGYGVVVTGPKMEAMLKTPDFHTQPELVERFQKLHKQSEGVYKVALMLGLVLLIALGWESAMPYSPQD